LAENEEGPIRRAKKKDQPAASPEAAPAESSAAPATEAAPPANGDAQAECTRLRSALRSARKRLRRLIQENKTLREELLSAGEMIENLAQDLEKPY
jgi:hypothetical protein